ncbi:hydrolase 1, exosortase A system-associated [Scleromatobacter humisilvae]|uniref:Hydrolase 1, exosortase A system-associated n=1 Tax=Scleromatobacter humisilvae TaxID=2897159 RepID=A0A9X1YQR0_9BURK|nr:hydrolase 1, exosortase A system-associated [Scleromatobacter humisilvae]MCK9686346.1 hydrolase 1, exosortase A system-associated [Scleromatobacter humisilvae]
MSAERALTFDCQGDELVGVLCEPASPCETGVVVVVGGPQYRAGSHRQFVLLARALARQGFAVLRFDVRGMGDSAGAPRSFEDIGEDISAAIDTLVRHVPAVRRVALWGLCDGASAALLHVDAARDPRVRGLVLLNPWVRSPESLARVQLKHYYWQRLGQRAFWTKLLSGGVGQAAWRDLLANLKARRASAPRAAQLPYQHRMARGWAAFDGDILLVLSGNDYTAKEFVDTTRGDPAWTGALQHVRLQRHDLSEADHTFTAPAWRQRVEEITIAWLKTIAAAAPGTLREAA